METAPLNVLDELYLHLDRDDEPWSVQLEVRAEGTVEADRLEAAVREAARRHPLARARLERSEYRWEIVDELAEVPLETAAQDVAGARKRLFSRSPSLDRPGPFELLLVHDQGGDTIMLNLHHAAGDGLAALRLMGSIARAYGGEDDPLPSLDPLAVRDVSSLARPSSVTDVVKRARASLDYLTRGLAPPVRVASSGGGDEPGYGFELVHLAAPELERVTARRRAGATVNDVLLAALALTVRDWNAEHGGQDGSVYLMMPLNLRPSEWRFEVVGNYASYVSVRLDAGELTDFETAVEAAAATTRRIKEDGIAGLIVDLFGPPTLLPPAVKQRLQHLIPLTGNLVVDTAVLSNLGRLEAVPRLGDAGAIKAVWFSPPGRMPLGASVGAATLGGELFVTLRYRHALFDRRAGAAFARRYRDVLVGEL